MTAAGSNPTLIPGDVYEIGVDVATVTMLIHKTAPDLHET